VFKNRKLLKISIFPPLKGQKIKRKTQRLRQLSLGKKAMCVMDIGLD